jgi:hypothetical protein
MSEALRLRLAEHPDINVVGEVDHELDLLLAVHATEANLVIHSWPADAMPPILSQLLQEFPNVSVLGLGPDGQRAWLCEQRIVVMEVPGTNVDSLLNSLRSEHARPIKASA